MRGERGSGTILGLALVAAILLTVGTAIPALGGLVARGQAAGAADAAALGGADVASGAAAGSICETARAIAAANRATLDECTVDGLLVTVSARVEWLGLSVSARSRAGPPPEEEHRLSEPRVS